MNHLVSVNGTLMKYEEMQLSKSNRAFKYGDGIFETIRLEQGRILWADMHFQRLQRSAALLKYSWDPDFDKARFLQVIGELYHANHAGMPAVRIRFAMFRHAGGYYTPLSSDVSYIIESESLTGNAYPWNPTGLSIGIYPEQQKMAGPYASLKTSSALLYVLAALYKQEMGLDDCLIMNNLGHIAEGISSNIFLVKGGQVITPSLDQACVDGIMRRVLIELLLLKEVPVLETVVDTALLTDADEVFMTNAIQGISQVSQYGNKQYSHDFSRQCRAWLTEHAHNTL